MKKKLVLFIFCLILIVSCGKKGEPEYQAFNVKDSDYIRLK